MAEDTLPCEFVETDHGRPKGSVLPPAPEAALV